MYSFFLIYAYVSFACATEDSELNFDTHNQCGCYRRDKCPYIYQPECIYGLSNYEDFYLQNSAFTNYTEECNRWSLEGFTQNLTISENGTLKTTLYFSPLLNVTTFELQLRYQNLHRDNCENMSTFHLLDSSHSKKHFIVQGTSTDSCKKMVEVSFPFVFSGCYQLYINNTTNSGISGGCMTKSFYVTSSYYKTPLNNLQPKSSCSYQIQRQELVSTTVFGNFSNGLNPYSTTVTLKSHIDLSLDDCSGSGNEAAKYILADRGNCCHAIHHDSYLPRNMSDCPCIWEDDSTLECKFKEIENGNYCIIIEFIDPRCEKSTLWTKIERKYASCAWSCDIEAKGHVTSIEIEPYKADNFFSTLILCFSLLIFGTATILLFALYFFKIKKKRHSSLGENIAIMEKPFHFINEDCEILFLYPRDCEEFMKAMIQFRILLKDSCLCKVYDPWDEEIFDKVAESIETWSLPLIKNKNVKIIVVLTECSKIIEEAYIDDKHSVTYRNPKAFDKIFGQSLKALNEYFATRSDSYQRVFVVRLDETPVINLSFHFNCATVYILPHGLQTLINDLQNGNAIHMNKENIILLETAIQEYLIYKQQHLNYLNDIVKVNNNSKIIKLLKN